MTNENPFALPMEQSKEYFNSGLLCAESVLLAVTGYKGVENELIPRIATGFCSGMARTCGNCGAVSGGILAINVFFGRDKPKTPYDVNYKLVSTFLRSFEEQFGSINCQGLLGCDLGTEEGQKYFWDNGLKTKNCDRYVETAVRMALELIEGEGPAD